MTKLTTKLLTEGRIQNRYLQKIEPYDGEPSLGSPDDEFFILITFDDILIINEKNQTSTSLANLRLKASRRRVVSFPEPDGFGQR